MARAVRRGLKSPKEVKPTVDSFNINEPTPGPIKEHPGNTTIFKGKDINHVPDLAEFRAFIRQIGGDSNTLELVSTLRMHCATVELDGKQIDVFAFKAIIGFSLEGLEEIQDSRLADEALIHKRQVKRKVKITANEAKKFTTKGSIGASLVSPIISAVIGGKYNKEISKKTDQYFNDLEILRRVQARPNCRWEFSDPDKGHLDGTYLREHKLCHLSRTKNANRSRVEGHLIVLQRDLDFGKELSKGLFGFERTKEKLLKIFISKYLQEQNSGNFVGVVRLSQVEIEVEP